MSAQLIADRYFAAMRAQDLDALLALFAPEGVIIWPNGTEVAGHEAIRKAYTGLFSMPTNNPTPGAIMTGPGSFATEVHSRLPDGSERRTCNVFHLGPDGLVMRMTSYRRD